MSYFSSLLYYNNIVLINKKDTTVTPTFSINNHLPTTTTAAKGIKCSVRDFSYSVEEYANNQSRVKQLQAEYSKQENNLKRHCAASYSDTLVAWMHCKAIRVFVEAILRYGVPPNFAAFIVKPTGKNQTKLRSILSDVFSASGLFGQSYIGSAADKKASSAEKEGDTDEAYYPYVSLDLSPFAEKTQS